MLADLLSETMPHPAMKMTIMVLSCPSLLDDGHVQGTLTHISKSGWTTKDTICRYFVMVVRVRGTFLSAGVLPISKL
jgi:hypothetical protein